MTPDPKQDEAFTLAIRHDRPIVGVTGQAGTGKTTLMKRIHCQEEAYGQRVAVAAPTGRAAKRITEASDGTVPAMTIHRLLEFTHPGDPDPETGKPVGRSMPRRFAKNPLPFDIVLVDEYSMVNDKLDAQLRDALPTGARLRVFGDANQLPPIPDEGTPEGDQSPFQRHLTDEPSVTLSHIHRQGEGSGIVQNAHLILQRRPPVDGGDVSVRVTEDQRDAVLKMVRDDLQPWATTARQIITPTNKGPLGTADMNRLVRALLFRPTEGIRVPRNWWDRHNELWLAPGDKVIWTKNDYNLWIFNGESGIVTEVNRDHITIDFGDRTVAVPPWLTFYDDDGEEHEYQPQASLQLGYVITTHKAQGGEHEEVIYLLGSYMNSMLYRNNFYTGLTRARKRATVISDSWALHTAPCRAPLRRRSNG